eukprot:1471768-Rhodomonas_salina.1
MRTDFGVWSYGRWGWVVLSFEYGSTKLGDIPTKGGLVLSIEYGSTKLGYAPTNGGASQY